MNLHTRLFLCLSLVPLCATAQTTAAPSPTPQPATTQAPASQADAQVTQEVSTTQAQSQQPTNPLNLMMGNVSGGGRKVLGSLSMGYNSNLYQPSAVEFESSATYSARLDYVLGSGNLIRGVVSGFHQGQGARENRFNDGFLAWVNNGFWRRGEIVTVGQQVRFIAPMSEESYKRDEKLTGVTLAPLLLLNLTPVGLTGVTFVYLPQLTKNFHKYETSRANTNNQEYSISNIFSMTWSFTDQWYWRNDFVHLRSWSYGGVQSADRWQAAIELGYTFQNGLNLAGGLSNAGAIRNFQNGNDQTVNLFNNRTASAYTELSYFF